MKTYSSTIRWSMIAITAVLISAASAQQRNYQPYLIKTVAGNGQFTVPLGVAVDSHGNVYVADTGTHTIKKIEVNGTVTVLAGLSGSAGNVDGQGSAARFNQPSGLTIDSNGVLYVADTYNNSVRKVNSDGTVTTYAVGFDLHEGVVADRFGNVYVADTHHHRICKIASDGTFSVIAGGNQGAQDGVGGVAQFNLPVGLAVDQQGNLYVADYGNNAIRKIAPDATVTTFAGALASNSGFADGFGSAARFSGPYGLASDDDGNLYVGDYGNNCLRKISSSGEVRTLAGFTDGAGNFYGNADGVGSMARFYHPSGIALSQYGQVYVADFFNNSIRVGTPATVPAIAISHSSGNTFNFTCLGTPNATNRIEYSTNLAPNSFTTLTSIAVDGTCAFSFDDVTSDSKRFFRVVYP